MNLISKDIAQVFSIDIHILLNVILIQLSLINIFYFDETESLIYTTRLFFLGRLFNGNCFKLNIMFIIGFITINI